MNNRLLSEEEMLECSLVSTEPLKALRDVIEETCKHQDAKTLKAIVNYLAYKMLPTSKNGEWVGLLPKTDWEYLLKISKL